MNELNKAIIRKFWKSQSTQVSNRWTSKDLLDFETDYILNFRQQLTSPITILDLGSGAGELSKSIQGDQDALIAVDYEKNFRHFFSNDRNQKFIESDVLNFGSTVKFDLILLYGVVTYLSNSEESEIYRLILDHLEPAGIAFIKHQVSLNDEILIDSYSKELKTHYSARYPSRAVTEEILKTFFDHVKPFEYPKKYNKFHNTINIAYLVRNN